MGVRSRLRRLAQRALGIQSPSRLDAEGAARNMSALRRNLEANLAMREWLGIRSPSRGVHHNPLLDYPGLDSYNWGPEEDPPEGWEDTAKRVYREMHTQPKPARSEWTPPETCTHEWLTLEWHDVGHTLAVRCTECGTVFVGDDHPRVHLPHGTPVSDEHT
jgi:hypothetical protein